MKANSTNPKYINIELKTEIQCMGGTQGDGASTVRVQFSLETLCRKLKAAAIYNIY